MSTEVAAAVDEKVRKGRKPVVMIGAGLLLLVVIAGGVWFSGVIGHSHHGKGGSFAVVEKPVFFDLPDIVSNLDTGGHRASFIKLHAKLGIAHAIDVPAVQAAVPQILDIFQTYLRSMRPEEVRGGEGTFRLREALMNRIDLVLAPIQLTDMLFTEMLVQ
ncbi:flagellar basal body-associated FliL family protein [Lichenicola sp.]|uniref:flagellar basal body-associated FliL family protein n=1 Tax=Lichenicola sp. TaxID=2804529 RepID=UPI003B004ECC